MNETLAGIENELQEMKYFIDILSNDPDTALAKIVKRKIANLQSGLGDLLQEVETISQENATESIPETEELLIPTEFEEIKPVEEIVVAEIEQPADAVFQEDLEEDDDSIILAERLKPAVSLKKSFTLNDTFRFSRELFSGDVGRMEQILNQIEAMESLEHVHALLENVLNVTTQEETDAYNDFQEIIKKYFV